MKAGRASSTARLIAAATILREFRHDRAGVGPSGAANWCDRLLATNARDRWLRASVRSRWGRCLWQGAEQLFLPGIVSHWMRRKREIDRLTRQAANTEFTQLIVLGAGLDTLALRMHDEQLFRQIISVDHPATLAIARAAFDSSRTPTCLGNSSLQFLASDLAQDDLDQILNKNDVIDRQAATVVVIEGVLMYLRESHVKHLLEALANLPVPRLRLIASSMVAEPGERAGFRGQSRWVDRWLRSSSEPMLWACPRRELPGVLTSHGWNSARLIDLTIAEETHQKHSCGLSSELLVVADQRPEPNTQLSRRSNSSI